MAKIWAQAFWKQRPEKFDLLEDRKDKYKELKWNKKLILLGPVAFLLMISLWIGFGADLFFQISDKIATELQNPELYIKAVLK